MTTNTPGPWTVVPGSESTDPITVRALDMPAGERDIGMIYGMRDRMAANARLIAAAPELLAALEAIIVSADAAEWPEQDAVDAMLLAARAAIARAKGE